MEKVREQYFYEYDKSKKIILENQIKAIQKKLFDIIIELQIHSSYFNKLINWNPFEDKASDWFDPSWIFGIKGGFDIVIGNPPYIQLQKAFNDEIKFADLYKEQKFQTFERTGDIYCLFYEKAQNILSETGHLTYITSNKWMRANYGKSLRKFLSQNTTPKIIIDFSGFKVFESATVDTIILISQNSPLAERCHGVTRCSACTMQNDYNKGKSVSEYFKQNSIELSELSEDSWIISSPEEMRIKQKIEKIGTPLKDWDISINYGIKTGFNEAFIISGEKKDELISADPKSADIIKPILRGRDIKRYKAEFADLWLIASHNGYKDENDNKIERINIEDYPAIKEHLDKYWEQISKRYDKGDTPYNLRNCDYMEEFGKKKVVYPNMTQVPCFAYSNSLTYCNDKSFILSSTSISVKFIIGVLNSSFVDFILRYLCSGLGLKGLEVRKIFIKNLPIPRVTSAQQQLFERIVNEILVRKENTPNFDKSKSANLQEGNKEHLENQIDIMVYKLYELTYEEAKIVDPEIDNVLSQFGLSKEDYKRMSVEELARLNMNVELED